MALLLATFPGRAERVALPLDGPWQFALDPQDGGRTLQWFKDEVRFTNTIRVPGAWQAQGYGAETDKLRHHYVGKAWYKRRIHLPPTRPGEHLFLCFGGVHRSAEIWLDGRRLGEHVGYLSPFEFELPSPSSPHATATLAVCVDGAQHWDVDCLTGCTDIIDAMFTPWGGLSGHVRLEVRPAAWLEDVFVQTTAFPAACVVTGRLAGDTNTVRRARLEVLSPGGHKVATVEGTVSSAGELRLETEIPDPKLWSPDSPALYTARLELLADSLSPSHHSLDRVKVPFGLREIQICGHDFYLNGSKLYLCGYGDDAIYPQTMAPPTDKEFYRRRLSVAKAYGFNFVRHHSHFLPPEYYEAADEVGMLISPEFPIAYQEYYQKARGPALELYRTEWAAVIKRFRNHPSIFDWSMSNEEWGSFPLAPELYRIAKSLDPSRPVIDSDGLDAGTFVQRAGDRDTLDFFPVQFDENALPLDRPDKHRFAVVPKKPVLSHETGNYVTAPRLDLAGQFKDNFKPFWLLPFYARLERLGLLAEAGQWSLNSERLYCLAHKLNIENMRLNPRLSGYMWWLLQDYWTGSNGLLDTYFRAKSIRPALVRQFNSPAVLLQNGLPPTCSTEQPLRTKLLLSNYSPSPIRDGLLKWTVKLGDRVLAKSSPHQLNIGQGELAEIAAVELTLPAIAQPQKLTLEADLKTATLRAQNDWSAWVYPAQSKIENQKSITFPPLYAARPLLPLLQHLGAQPLPQESPLPAHAVFVVRQPTLETLAAVETGASLICLAPQELFPTVPNRFKPAWWLGSPNDCNAGTVVYPHPVTRAIAPDGWCDLGWYHLLEGAQAVVLDHFPAQPAVLVRGLDVHTVCRSKALLFEARVGDGSLIVSGLRLEPAADAPESAWLLDRLIEYAGTFPQPQATLPAAFLRQKLSDSRQQP